MLTVSEENFMAAHCMVLGSARYYMGRSSIAAASFPGELRKILDEIPEKTQWMLCHDVIQWRDDGTLCHGQGWESLAREIMERNGWQEGGNGMLVEGRKR